jgi:hypothetical protein
MKSIFCIITKSEFISLLNNLELKDIHYNRFFTKIEIKNINDKSIFFKIPYFEYDEDCLVISCLTNIENDGDKELYKKITIVDVTELIPVTITSFLAYKRKFSSSLKWTEPSIYNFEEAYNLHLEEKIRIDSFKNFKFCERYILKIEDELIVDKVLLNQIIEAKIDKQLKGKKDIDIRKNEYIHIFQSLMIYEQGSYLSRENAMGFLLHAIGVIILHDGKGSKLGLKINLNKKSETIIKLKEIGRKNNLISFEDVFTNVNVINEVELYLSKTKSSIDINDLKIIVYFLFYYFLVNEKKVGFRIVYQSIKQLKREHDFSREEKIAFLLVATNCSTSKIAEDVMIENHEVTIIDRQKIPRYDSEFDFITNYYKPSKKYFNQDENSNKEVQTKTVLQVLDPLQHIRNNLPPELSKEKEKKLHFENVILVEYKEILENSAYDLTKENIKKEIYKKIFPRKTISR